MRSSSVNELLFFDFKIFFKSVLIIVLFESIDVIEEVVVGEEVTSAIASRSELILEGDTLESSDDEDADEDADDDADDDDDDDDDDGEVFDSSFILVTPLFLEPPLLLLT
ncbi:unnamed protein product [[Candida] boidinii]|uniref:Unnamed protein product n=1 Tax=Candida boidinii TaxID=5477 RepID=A0A9W6T1N7_CANBO|nr:unnamed protein product [[Candida] boidinii]GMG09500.1 unnamed protein product [[Candida] boidinii]